MLISNLPFLFSDFSQPELNVAPYAANFMEKFYSSYYKILQDVYKEEYYMLDLHSYDIANDIFYLYYLLVKIHLEILNTEEDERLTYGEYMEKYHLDCVFKSLICRGFNAKKLMIAFDSGYSNISLIPTIVLNEYEDDGGISWFKVPDTSSEINDFKIS